MDIIDRFQGKFRWLSNFWPSPFRFHGVEYPTVEHFYQASKCESASDAHRIMLAATPGEAKRRGRRALCRSDWDDIKVPVMLLGLTLKFKQNSSLMKLLQATSPAALVEGNDRGNTFWGRCDGARRNDIIERYHGTNMLGILLMLVRDGPAAIQQGLEGM